MKNIISVSTLLFCCVYMYAAHVEPSLSRVEPLRELACKAVFANALACKEIQETIENTPLGELSGLETLLDTSYTKRLVASLYPPVMQSESVVLEGHNDWVRCLAINPITGDIVLGSTDNTLLVWNGETKKCVAVLEGHNDWVRCLAINPITGEIVSGSYDKTLRVWNGETRKCVAVLEGHNGWVSCVAINPITGDIVSGSTDNTLRVWNGETKKCVAVLEGHNDWVRCLAINPITGEIVSGSYDKTLRVWNGETRKCVAVLEGHNGWVSCVAINPITGEIVSGSDDKTLRVWQKPSITQEINRYAENEVILAALRIKTHLRNNKKAGIDQLLDDQVEDTKQYLEALQKKRIAFMPH